eukprot:scaffold2319_cov248-Pinguiococcus_pyrenoidosus.AAC.7
MLRHSFASSLAQDLCPPGQHHVRQGSSGSFALGNGRPRSGLQEPTRAALQTAAGTRVLPAAPRAGGSEVPSRLAGMWEAGGGASLSVKRPCLG